MNLKPRMHRPLAFFLVIPALLLGACALHQVRVPTQVTPHRSWNWIDLQPGWRVQVVAPVVRSGGHLAEGRPLIRQSESQRNDQASAQKPGSVTITLKTGKDFVGYEVSLYAVKPRRSGGVKVVFRSAVIHQGTKKMDRPHPIVPLFRLPRKDSFVRILHLAWGNYGDHDAAVLAANRRSLLDAFTKKVQYRPTVCGNAQSVYCSWIPPGVAVVPQRRKHTARGSEWVPAY